VIVMYVCKYLVYTSLKLVLYADFTAHGGEYQGPAVSVLRARGGSRCIAVAAGSARPAQRHLHLSGTSRKHFDFDIFVT
jgi:hypothetical protein